jgi:hypothetical protein
MKRDAVVSVLCALMFTNVLAAADAIEIGSLVAKCAAIGLGACKELDAAIQKLPDQGPLAKVAIEAKDWQLRQVAAARLTDQALLAKIAVESEDANVRNIAVGRLTDQALLTKIAVEEKDPHLRRAAVTGLTDQAKLAKIAIEDHDLYVRLRAVENLNDQALLAKVAEKGGDKFVRTMAIAAMDKSNPALKLLAGDLGTSTSESGASIARIKLAIQEPPIRNRLPRILFVGSVSDISQTYTRSGIPLEMRGESVSFVLSEGRNKLAEKGWRTDFPGQLATVTFLGAKVHGEDLLAELLHHAVFTQDDLTELSSSEIPEVRQAAVGKLTDQALLAKIAAKDRNADVRRVAEQGLAEILKRGVRP